MCISFDIRIYMFTCTKKNISFPIRFLQEKLSPLRPPLTESPGRYGSSSTWCIASHGSKEILAMYVEVWEKKTFELVFYKKNYGGTKFDYIYSANYCLFLYKTYLLLCLTLYSLFAMCSEPLAVSSDISGKCLFVFLEANASKQHLWHLGCFVKMMGVTSPIAMCFSFPTLFV